MFPPCDYLAPVLWVQLSPKEQVIGRELDGMLYLDEYFYPATRHQAGK